jgi:2-polyprenyl-3-methyl-5-hydroxy-6-metoxy-1,4-benzoquinol methylase
MTTKAHWEAVYREKAPTEVSWYRPHLERSLQFIEEASPDHDAAIIDVGGGESTLVDDLLTLGYHNISVLDISCEAIQVAQRRLGKAAEMVEWIVDDITQATLPEQRYALWHDRAVFHFLVEPELQAAYVRQMLHSLIPNGHMVMATFGPEGPQRCSGLEVRRYNAESLYAHLGSRFTLVSQSIEEHLTPGGEPQQFLYVHFKLEDSGCPSGI